MIYIHTDSTCDLSQEQIDQNRINIIPLYVLIGNQSYVDRLEVSLSDLFQSVKNTGQLPKTSAVPSGDFINAFSRPGEHIYIGISSQLSATVKNAQIAADDLPGSSIYIIDSMNLSSGIGMLALQAARLRDEGLSADQIVARIAKKIPLVRTSFVIETLDYLYKGGRCSAMQNIVGSLLHIRPVISVRSDGTLGVKERVRGTRIKALNLLLDDLRQNIPHLDNQQIFITHTGCDPDAEMLRKEISRMLPNINICITYAGSVIASHCGPDTIGIIYMLKDGHSTL